MKHIKIWAGLMAFGLMMAGTSGAAMATTITNPPTINADVEFLGQHTSGGVTEYDYSITNNSATHGILSFTLNGADITGASTNGGTAPNFTSSSPSAASFFWNGPTGLAPGGFTDLQVFSTSPNATVQTNDANVGSNSSTSASGSVLSPVPVPATMAMLLSGLPCLGAIGFVLNRRKTALA